MKRLLLFVALFALLAVPSLAQEWVEHVGAEYNCVVLRSIIADYGSSDLSRISVNVMTVGDLFAIFFPSCPPVADAASVVSQEQEVSVDSMAQAVSCRSVEIVTESILQKAIDPFASAIYTLRELDEVVDLSKISLVDRDAVLEWLDDVITITDTLGDALTEGIESLLQKWDTEVVPVWNAQRDSFMGIETPPRSFWLVFLDLQFAFAYLDSAIVVVDVFAENCAPVADALPFFSNEQEITGDPEAGTSSHTALYSFSSDEAGLQPVLGPLSLPAAIYIFTATTDGFMTVLPQSLSGDCGMDIGLPIFNLMAGQAADGAQSVVEVEIDCDVLLEIGNTTESWMLEINKLS